MRTAWQILYYAWIAGEIFIALSTRRRDPSSRKEDRGSLHVLWLVIVLSMSGAGFASGLVPRSSRWHAGWFSPASLLLLACGLTIRTAAILTLGRWFTANVVTHREQTIQRKGLYSLVRHPSYLGLEIIFLAVGLETRSWLGLACAVLPPTLAVLYRIRVEEAALTRAFGDSYRDYCRSTRRLFPLLY